MKVISWFEIPAIDFERALKFYKDVFGWDIKVEGEGEWKMGVFPHVDGVVGGAIIMGDPSDKGTLVYLNGGDDLNKVLQRVEPAGGRVHKAKKLISPDIGYFAVFIDSEGNKVALHSPK